jgi:hypothetical protein
MNRRGIEIALIEASHCLLVHKRQPREPSTNNKFWSERNKLNEKRNNLADALEIITSLDWLTPPEDGWRIEHRFDDKREWRFDYAHTGLMLAIEINGGVHVQGRHVRGEGFKGDMQKLNSAQLQGWTVLQYTPQMTKAMLRDVKIFIGDIKFRHACPNCGTEHNP